MLVVYQVEQFKDYIENTMNEKRGTYLKKHLVILIKVVNMLTNKFRKLFEVYSKFIVENKEFITENLSKKC